MKLLQTSTILPVTLLLAGVTFGQATQQWNGNSGVDNNWETAANWSAAPASGDNVNFRGKTGAAQDATAQLSSAATIGDLLMGGAGATSTKGTPTLTLKTGSALTINDDTHIGWSLVSDSSAAVASLNIESGIHTAADLFNIGNAAGTSDKDATGTLTISGGQLTLAGVGKVATRGASATGTSTGTVEIDGGLLSSTKTGVGFYVGDYGNGSLILNGGNATFAGNVNVAQQTGSSGTISLLDGILDCVTVTMGNGDASMEIGQGLLTMDLNRISLINDWVADNDIASIGGIADDSSLMSIYSTGLTTVTNGSFVLKYGYDSTNAETAVWSQAIPEPATLGLIALFGGGVLFVRRIML